MYDLHGVTIGVDAADPAVHAALELRLRAFANGAVDDPDVRFAFLDGAAPPSTGRPVYDTPYGTIHYDPAADLLAGELDGVHLRCAATDGRVTLHAPAFAGWPLYLATHSLTTIALMELLERRGRYSLHAACLARDGRGLLLAGPTGSGKSTLTLALLRAGLEFVADDTVFLTPAGDVLGFPDAVAIRDGEPTPGFPKRLERIEAALLECAPKALVFPHVVRDRPGELSPLDPREAWLRLVPDVLLTHPHTTALHLEALAALLDRVDCYELASGTDLARSAQLAADLI
jgi:hypothetical protein